MQFQLESLYRSLHSRPQPPAPADPAPLIVAQVDAPLLVPPAAAVEAPAPDVALLALGAVGGSVGGGGSGSGGGRGRRGKAGRGTHPRAAEIGSGMQSLDPRDLERAEAEFVQFCGSFFVLGKLPLTSWLEGVLGRRARAYCMLRKLRIYFQLHAGSLLLLSGPHGVIL